MRFIKTRYNSTTSSWILATCLMIATSGSAIVCAQSAVDGAMGTVADISGAVIPNATVEVRGTATNAASTISSDASGYFRVPRLAPGDYTVQVAAPGFANYTGNM